jgi:hypothetical protein
MTLTLRDVRWSADTGRLARAVAASETLSAILPREQVDELLAAYAAATQSLGDARKLRPELPDIFAKVDPSFRAGKAVDPAKLTAELVEAQAKHDQVNRVITALAQAPDKYRAELEMLINNSVDGFIEQLDERLQALLDEAEEVFHAMPGVTDADSAIAAGKHAEWATFREQGKRYVALRMDHLAVLRQIDQLNFGERSTAIGHAWFQGLADVVPGYEKAMADRTERPGPQQVGYQVSGLPFLPNDPSDLGHWTATVRDRAGLQPIADYADEALSRMIAANRRLSGGQEPGVQREQSALARDYGGNESAMTHSFTARAIRAHGPELRAREAELRRSLGLDY